jgi:hypothetical protein
MLIFAQNILESMTVISFDYSELCNLIEKIVDEKIEKIRGAEVQGETISIGEALEYLKRHNAPKRGYYALKSKIKAGQIRQWGHRISLHDLKKAYGL